MTIIYIPELPVLSYALASHNLELYTDRCYYYTRRPYLAVVVVMNEAETISYRLVGKFDCSIGDHGANAHTGYTAPANAGRLHSKLTIRSRVPDSTPHDLSWDEFLEGAPLDTEREDAFNWMPHTSSESIHIPDVVHHKLKGYAAQRGMNLSQLFWAWAEEMLDFNLD